MNYRMPRCGWIILLLSAGCGSSDGQQTSWTPAPAATGPQANGGSSGAPADPSGSGGGAAGSSSGGGTDSSGGAQGTPSVDTGSGRPPATASAIAGSIDGGTTPGSTGSSSSGSPSPAATPTPDAFTGAPAYVSKVGSSPHNAGKSCLSSGCHGGGGGDASPFLIGGTVYKDYKGTVPAPGVEIRVKDMAGNTVSVYSGTNGNFYINSSGSGITLPAIVGARDGTTSRPMITNLTSAAMGSCASAGCHILGGTDGGPVSGAYYPIHVP
jgi:hypothetical protein